MSHVRPKGMDFVNDPKVRDEALKRYHLLRDEKTRPVAASTIRALKMQEREDEIRLYRAVDAGIKQDLEELEKKSEKEPERKLEEKKVSQLNTRLAIYSETSFRISSDVLANHVLPCLDLDNDMQPTLQLVKTSRSFRKFFQPVIDDSFPKLLRCIARGQNAEAKRIIELNPDVLKKRGNAEDYSGNIIKDVTPLELAYGADNIDMCKIILSFLDAIPGGREEAKIGMLKRFPESKEESHFDFKNLIGLTDNHPSLIQFREQFKPRIIKQGKHFNIRAFLSATETQKELVEIALQGKAWRAPDGVMSYQTEDPVATERAILFWRHVIGYFQRMWPACYAQSLCQGFSDISEGKPLMGNLKLEGGSFFFPMNPLSQEQAGLGYDYGVYLGTNNLSAIAAHTPGSRFMSHIYPLFLQLAASKDISVTELMQYQAKELKDPMQSEDPPVKGRCCVVM